MTARSLLGIIDANGHTFAVRPIDLAENPATMIPLIRLMWSGMRDADVETLARHRLPDEAPPGTGGGPSPIPPLVRGDLHTAGLADQANWLYLINPYALQVLVYEATADGRWLRHSAHPLPSDAGHTSLPTPGEAID